MTHAYKQMYTHVCTHTYTHTQTHTHTYTHTHTHTHRGQDREFSFSESAASGRSRKIALIKEWRDIQAEVGHSSSVSYIVQVDCGWYSCSLLRKIAVAIRTSNGCDAEIAAKLVKMSVLE